MLSGTCCCAPAGGASSHWGETVEFPFHPNLDVMLLIMDAGSDGQGDECVGDVAIHAYKVRSS
jgi:hypothetical protein